MPRVKLGKDRAAEKLIVLIWGTKDALGYTNEELANALGVSVPVLYKRKANPDEFKLKELKKIARFLNIPIEDVRQCIGF